MQPSLPLAANDILIDSSCRPFRLLLRYPADIGFSLPSGNPPDGYPSIHSPLAVRTITNLPTPRSRPQGLGE